MKRIIQIMADEEIRGSVLTVGGFVIYWAGIYSIYFFIL